ncbi:hypothetical protein GGR50DRAFT_668141 [Xylaria sp. CBS 124048]|nr:hypothetical protein GGR50DRAFT_668141 [Xylaria sp. CBS 124048]
MTPLFRLLTRATEEDSNRHSDDNHYPSHEKDNGERRKGLPLGMILLIVYASILTVLFFSSLIYYWKRETERKNTGQSFRTGRVLWKAVCVATGLWIWAWMPQTPKWLRNIHSSAPPPRSIRGDQRMVSSSQSTRDLPPNGKFELYGDIPAGPQSYDVPFPQHDGIPMTSMMVPPSYIHRPPGAAMYGLDVSHRHPDPVCY